MSDQITTIKKSIDNINLNNETNYLNINNLEREECKILDNELSQLFELIRKCSNGDIELEKESNCLALYDEIGKSKVEDQIIANQIKPFCLPSYLENLTINESDYSIIEMNTNKKLSLGNMQIPLTETYTLPNKLEDDIDMSDKEFAKIFPNYNFKVINQILYY